MSKKIIRGFRTNMTLYSLCLIAFVAVTVPFEPLLALAEAVVAVLVILVGRRRNKMAQASVRQYMDRVSGGMDTARSSNMLYAPLPMLVFDVTTGEILWCNDMFMQLTAQKEKIFETAVDAVIPPPEYTKMLLVVSGAVPLERPHLPGVRRSEPPGAGGRRAAHAGHHLLDGHHRVGADAPDAGADKAPAGHPDGGQLRGADEGLPGK